MANNRYKIFAELNKFYFLDKFECKLSSLENKDKIINEIKTLKIIEIDNLDEFYSYSNYDHFLIFKNKNEYYFCNTELIPAVNKESLLKITDFNHYLRKDKIKKIESDI